MVITEIKMKKIIYVLVAIFIAACSKSEDSTFLTDISEDVFSFKPIAGVWRTVNLARVDVVGADASLRGIW